MTDPRTSTSGIHSLIAAYDAATGKSEPTTEDIKTPTARAFVAGVEKSVSHYASTAGIFLDNMARADSLTFASAVAVEEQEVFNYNEGLHSPVTPKEPPRIGLDAFYPAGGTLFADHPFVTLRAPWVNQAKSNIARNFLDWLQEPTQQSRFTDDGFRDYTHAAFGALASEPGILKAKPADLPLPNADTVAAIARSWSDLRDPARIELVIDLSDASQRVAAQKSVGELLDTDQVAVWDVEPSLSRMLLALTTLGGGRPKVLAAIDSAPLTRGPGPLYLTIKSAYESLVENADATHINAIIIITAHRDDGLAETLTDLEREIRAQTGQGSVRIYAVALQGSDTDALSGIASASGGVAAISTSPANAVRTSLGNF